MITSTSCIIGVDYASLLVEEELLASSKQHPTYSLHTRLERSRNNRDVTIMTILLEIFSYYV